MGLRILGSVLHRGGLVIHVTNRYIRLGFITNYINPL